MFTHITKKTRQRCFGAVWWPSKDASLGSREKAYPLMVFESGQIDRVNANNLEHYKGER